MAKYVLSNAGIKVGETSGSLTEVVAKSATIDISVDAPDVTDFGQLTRHHLAGLRSWSGSFEVNQDHASGKADATLWGLIGKDAHIRIAEDKSITAKTVYSGNMVITSYGPISGSVGDGSSASVSFQGSETLSRGSTF